MEKDAKEKYSRVVSGLQEAHEFMKNYIQKSSANVISGYLETIVNYRPKM
jgi:hypothetical protein